MVRRMQRRVDRLKQEKRGKLGFGVSHFQGRLYLDVSAISFV